MKTWAATGERALNSTGTLGSVVEQFTDGEGDIWSDIVNAVLTILENTEGWSEIADVLNKLFAMFEPVTQAIIDLIISLPWDDIILFFRVAASALVIIAKIVEGITRTVSWLWDNIKTALHNLGDRLTNWGRNQWSYKSLDSYLGDIHKTLATAQERLNDIWNTEVNIDRSVAKDDLAALWKLYNSKLIDENTFYKGADVLQQNLPFEALVGNRPVIHIVNQIVDTSGNVIAEQERTFEENGIELNHPLANTFFSSSFGSRFAFSGR